MAAALPLQQAWSRWWSIFSSLHFDEEDIEYPARRKQIFDEDFLAYLRNFHFTGDIYAVPEGTPVFPRRAYPDRPRPCH